MSEHRTDFAEIYEAEEDAGNPIIRLYTEYGRSHLSLLAPAVVGLFLSTIIQLLPEYLIGVAINIVAEGPESFSLVLVPEAWLPGTVRGQFFLTLGLLLGAAVTTSVLYSFYGVTWAWFMEETKHDLRVDVYRVTQDLGLDFFTESKTGDVMSVVNDDINELSHALNDWPKNILRTSTQIFGAAGFMLYLHWQLGLLTILATLPMALTTYLARDPMASRYAEVRRMVGRLNARIENSVSGIETVKSYTNEAYERDRVAESSDDHREAAWAVSKLNAVFRPAMHLCSEFAYLVVFLVGGWWAVFGPPLPFLNPLSIGVFVTTFMYTRRFAGSIGGLRWQVGWYYHLRASATRVYGLMASPASVRDAPDAEHLEGVRGGVEYEDVTFRYPGTDESALRDVSFEAEPGEYIGLVGPTGAGKTTLLKLLVRFYDPDEGTVRVDSRDVSDVTLASLRGSIGYVSQEPLLFDDTVRENIAYDDRDAPEASIVEAAKRANAHEFVTGLPDGYATRVGERGVKLSGGQRQRIAIARAVLKDPPILILDEATSHVDNETELLIQESLADLIADRTTFAIAHSLSTVRDADQLLVLEDGEVVERGTHEELLDAGELYAALWGVHVGETDDLPDVVDVGGGADG